MNKKHLAIRKQNQTLFHNVLLLWFCITFCLVCFYIWHFLLFQYTWPCQGRFVSLLHLYFLGHSFVWSGLKVLWADGCVQFRMSLKLIQMKLQKQLTVLSGRSRCCFEILPWKKVWKTALQLFLLYSYQVNCAAILLFYTELVVSVHR